MNPGNAVLPRSPDPGPVCPQDMIRFNEFSLADRELLTPYFRASGTRLCEYSFAVQYCWQAYNHSVWAVIDGMLVIRFEAGGHYRFTCPVGPGDRSGAIAKCLNWLKQHNQPAAIDFVPESRGCAGLPDGLAALPDPDNNDYIYLREELATLPGRRFAHKRNHISALSREHRWEVRRVPAGERIPELLAYVEAWAADRIAGEDAGEMELELEAVRRGIVNAGQLGMEVFELIVDGAIEGVALYDRTHPDMATCHFEKATIGIRGAYQAICSGAASLMPPDIVYINREQDMGVEGLRKTKASWNPVIIEPCRVIRPAVAGTWEAGANGDADADV